MSQRAAPIFADDKTAAQLFCMRLSEFQGLVRSGHLPRPREIGGFERWDVEELRMIVSGRAVDGLENVRWR